MLKVKKEDYSDKILLTGICYVYSLLEEKFGNPKRRHIKEVHPNFDVNKINFFREDIVDQFLFTDFHGRFSTYQNSYRELPKLLNFYKKCELMYCLCSTRIESVDVANIQPEDFYKFGSFWYFLFNEKWNPAVVRNWEKKRDKAMLNLLKMFPQLKFIFYQECCVKWWLDHNLPKDRIIYWNIDWGMSESDYEDIKRELEINNLRGGHRFPTEDSYNELCDLIFLDREKKRKNLNCINHFKKYSK